MIHYIDKEGIPHTVTVAYSTDEPKLFEDLLGKYYHGSGLGWNKANPVRGIYESVDQWKEQLEREVLLLMGIKKEN